MQERTCKKYANKKGRHEKHPRATVLRNMAEKKDKEEYTTSVVRLILQPLQCSVPCLTFPSFSGRGQPQGAFHPYLISIPLRSFPISLIFTEKFLSLGSFILCVLQAWSFAIERLSNTVNSLNIARHAMYTCYTKGITLSTYKVACLPTNFNYI